MLRSQTPLRFLGIAVGTALLAGAVVPGSGAVWSAPAVSAQALPPVGQDSGDEGQTPPDDDGGFNSLCLMCHGEPAFETSLPSGETLPLYVDQSAFEASAHGDLECIACHPEQRTIPHWPLTAADRRAFSLERARSCETCHEEAAESYEDSIHGVTVRLGLDRAAACADCHGNHDVQHPIEWSNEERAQRCQKCHEGADANFASGWLGHREPSPSWFPIAYYAERLLIVLTTAALGFGIIHVELELMRWAIDRFWRKKE